MGLLDGVAVSTEATGEFGLRQRLASFNFVQFAGFFDAERALDEGQAAVQFVLRKVPGQRDDVAAFGPRAV
ncbi:hypothetical protein D3C86_2250740 [compost metagenome]